MDEFLSEHPEHCCRRMLFEDLQRLAASGSLETQLGRWSIAQIKALSNLEHLNSKEMQIALNNIIKKEHDSVKGMVFKLLLRKKIVFTDMRLKVLFYKEFSEHQTLFQNESEDTHFLIADLFCRWLCLQDHVNPAISRLIDGLPIADRIFYCNILGTVLLGDYMFPILTSIPISLCNALELKCMADAVMKLKGNRKYAFIASSLLSSSDIEKVKIIRALPASCNSSCLVQALLYECFKDPETASSTYLICLKLIKLFGLPYTECLKVLCAWMRYFLWNNQATLFCELFESIPRAKPWDKEIIIYEKFYMFLRNKITVEKLEEMIHSYVEDNHYTTVDFRDVLLKYKT